MNDNRFADCSATIRQRPSLGLRGSSGAGAVGGRGARLTAGRVPGRRRAGISEAFIGSARQVRSAQARSTAQRRRRTGGRRATR